MNMDLEKRLDAVCESMEQAAKDFEMATTCCHDALNAMHDRLSRIEVWMNKEIEKSNKKKLSLIYKK